MPRARAGASGGPTSVTSTGFLIGTIQSKEAVITATGVEVEIVSAAEYSKYQELGTSKMAARPYMRPAIKEGQAVIEAAVATVLKIEIENAIK